MDLPLKKTVMPKMDKYSYLQNRKENNPVKHSR